MAATSLKRQATKMKTNGSSKTKTRTEEVYRKAAKLFRESGYVRTTMNDIAQALEIQKGSLYYYVKDKQSLLFVILDRITDTLLDTVKDFPLDNLSSQEKLTRLMHQHVLNVLEYRNEVPLLIYEAKHLPPKLLGVVLEKRRQYEDIFLKVIREGIADGTFLGHNQHVVAFFILGGVFWFFQWFSSEEMETQRVTEQSFLGLFLNGLLAQRTTDLQRGASHFGT